MVCRYRPRVAAAPAMVCVAIALTIVGCGGSSPMTNAAATNGAAGTSLGKSAQLHGDIVSNGKTAQRPMRGTGGDEINDDNPGRADSGSGSASGLNPCTLVPVSEVRTIVGEPIATAQEAPLGPTCIYGWASAKSQITVTVESVDFAKIRPEISDRTRVSVAHHVAYCGDYGQRATFVPLSGDRVLNITAPCAIGARLAEKALSSLNG